MLLGIIVLFTFFLNSFVFSATFNDDTSIRKRAKRNLICKEREYLKSQPISGQLKHFINKYKRKVKNPKTRIKHAAGDNMYVLDNGNIVPLNQIKIRNVDEYSSSSQGNSDHWRFTVLPLIIPKTQVTCETISTPPTIEVTTTNGNTSISSNLTSIAASSASTTGSTIFTTTNIGENAVVESGVGRDDYENIPVEATTKAKLLHKVIQDVEELIKYENEAKAEGELSLCNVTGDWDSYAGGVQIRIYSNPNPKIPRVQIVPSEPPMDGFLNGTTWNTTALSPFSHQSLVAITAVCTKNKKIAVFLGECRICEGAESIAGYWMVRRKSKNCKDREEANSIISDVLRKNNVRKLQQEHLAQIGHSTLPHTETTLGDT